jgi:hypothetical protein
MIMFFNYWFGESIKDLVKLDRLDLSDEYIYSAFVQTDDLETFLKRLGFGILLVKEIMKYRYYIEGYNNCKSFIIR